MRALFEACMRVETLALHGRERGWQQNKFLRDHEQQRPHFEPILSEGVEQAAFYSISQSSQLDLCHIQPKFTLVRRGVDLRQSDQHLNITFNLN